MSATLNLAEPEPEPEPEIAGTPALEAGPKRRASRPRVLLVASFLVAAILLAPLVVLLVEASGAGVGTVAHLIFRSLTATLLWNTVQLTVVVTALCGVIGTMAAWFVECTDLPFRRVWAVLVVVPFAIPDFVVSFGWASLTTWIQGFRGAVVVMTLAVYPLVYLPVAASLRSADPGQEEVARSLGVGRVRTFFRVTIGQARGAIVGGCLLVALVILAEYGAFEIVGFQTFTTEIFTELSVSYNVDVAAALSIVVVVLSIVVLVGDGFARGRTRIARTGAGVPRAKTTHRLGRSKVPVVLGFLLLTGLALGVPVGSSVYWMLEGGVHALQGVSLLDAAGHTAGYGAAAAGIATLMALPVALLVVRHPTRAARLLERSTFVVLAVPGVVIGFALSYFAERYLAGAFSRTAVPLIAAYAVMFFPLALVGVRASVAYAPVSLEEAARSLGQRRLAVLFRVTLPLVAPGLMAAFCLVFLAVATELTATLILIQANVETLARQFWAYQQYFSYGQAAPFALVMIGIAAVPSYVLARFFDRMPSRRAMPT
ncbi:MAG: iron ABC transporter permease [Acidimicrobiales bacterium]